MKVNKIAIGGDHAGYEYKKSILALLIKEKIEVVDFGPNSADSVDYPDFAHPVGKSVDLQKTPMGIVICGSGNGVCMTVNKYKNVRGALCWNKELARLARTHNNANILCIPSRFVSLRMARAMVKVFLTTEFEGGRHGIRVEKI